MTARCKNTSCACSDEASQLEEPRHGSVSRVVLGELTVCRTTGYSLTGNTSGRCPECGTQI